MAVNTNLHYLRIKDGKELDFLILIDNKVTHLIEVKTADTAPSKSFEHFSSFINKAKQIQLVKNIKREKTYPSGVEIRAIIPWLYHFSLKL